MAVFGGNIKGNVNSLRMLCKVPSRGVITPCLDDWILSSSTTPSERQNQAPPSGTFALIVGLSTNAVIWAKAERILHIDRTKSMGTWLRLFS